MRCLDLGARTILAPMVSSAEEVVRHCRYPGPGVDGGHGGGRGPARGLGRGPDYFARADSQLCVLVQVETSDGLAALDDITAVDGVDGVFFGPADLSASLGRLGRPAAPRSARSSRTRSPGCAPSARPPAWLITSAC
jgi:4-hydroxy-2-oxoheptanedioate aldolase